MGKWFSKFASDGAVGGTARHVADWYKVQISKADSMGINPTNLSDPNMKLGFIANLVDKCISARVNVGVSNPNDEALIYLVQQRKITDFLGLVLAILVCEAQFSENDNEVQAEFVRVIIKELLENKIPKEYICEDDLLEAIETKSDDDVYDYLIEEYQDILDAI